MALIPENVTSWTSGTDSCRVESRDHDPGTWTVSSDSETRAGLLSKQHQGRHPSAKTIQQPHSILKKRKESTLSQTSASEYCSDYDQYGSDETRNVVRNPYRKLRDPTELVPPISTRFKTEVSFEDADVTRRMSVASVRSTCSARSRDKSDLANGLESHQAALLRFRRPSSAPTILAASKQDGDSSGQPHIHSMTLYMDDYQHPGRTTKLTLSYSTANMSNSRLISADIARYAKRRENLIKHNIQQTEQRLSAQRSKREERAIQKQQQLDKLKKLEAEATQRYKLMSRNAPKEKIKENLLTHYEKEDFRQMAIKKRTSLLPGSATLVSRRATKPLIEGIQEC